MNSTHEETVTTEEIFEYLLDGIKENEEDRKGQAQLLLHALRLTYTEDMNDLIRDVMEYRAGKEEKTDDD